MYNNLERRSNIWGLGYDQRQKFVDVGRARDVRSGEARRAGLARLRRRRSTPTSRSRCGRCSTILRASGVKFGVLSKEQLHRRSGEAHRQRVHVPGARERQHRGPEGRRPEEDPDVVPALREDDRRRLPEVRLRGRDRPLVGLHRGADARADCRAPTRRRRGEQTVTFHDPCYLGRYAGKVDEPRALLERFGADISEPERNRDNPYCCGAGGGLLFADKEEEPGRRISDVRFKQLQATGANTVVTACPFCSIMLKGAGAARSRAQSSTCDDPVRRPDDVT